MQQAGTASADHMAELSGLLSELNHLGLVRYGPLPRRVPGRHTSMFGPPSGDSAQPGISEYLADAVRSWASEPSRGRAEESPGPGDHHIEGARWIHRIRLWWA